MSIEPSRLGEILIQRGVVTRQQIDAVLVLGPLERLGSALIERGYADADTVALALAQQRGVAAARLRHFRAVQPSTLRLIPPGLAARRLVVPLDVTGEQPQIMAVAFRDPDDTQAVREVASITGCEIVRCVAAEVILVRALKHFYNTTPSGACRNIPPPRVRLNRPVRAGAEPGVMTETGIATEGRPGRASAGKPGDGSSD